MARGRRIRIKTKYPVQWDTLSREAAVRQVAKALGAGSEPLSPELHRLISLFDMQAEELCEAGVSYETVKALNHQCALFY